MKSEVEFKLVEGTSPNRGPPSHSHKFIMIRHQFQAVRINSPCPHICYHWHCSFAQQAFQHFGRLFRACLCKVLLKLVSLHQMRLEDDKALKAGIGHYLSDLFGNPELSSIPQSLLGARAPRRSKTLHPMTPKWPASASSACDSAPTSRGPYSVASCARAVAGVRPNAFQLGRRSSA